MDLIMKTEKKSETCQPITLLVDNIFPYWRKIFQRWIKLLLKCCAALKCCLFIVALLRKGRLINYPQISECDLLGTALFFSPSEDKLKNFSPCLSSNAGQSHPHLHLQRRMNWANNWQVWPISSHTHTHTHNFRIYMFFLQALDND